MPEIALDWISAVRPSDAMRFVANHPRGDLGLGEPAI